MSSNDMFCTIMKHKTDIGLRIILKYVYEIQTKRCEFFTERCAYSKHYGYGETN